MEEDGGSSPPGPEEFGLTIEEETSSIVWSVVAIQWS